MTTDFTTRRLGFFVHRGITSLLQWFDSDHTPGGAESVRAEPDKVDWVRCIPFLVLHLGCIAVFWVGWSGFAVGAATILYFVRMFAVTGIHHRYFSHKTYSTSRVGQLLLALWGATAVQRGGLWWAYHHRHHHQHSDKPADVHSPHIHGFWWSHIGWITSRKNFPTDYSKIKDLAKFPELVWLNRFDTFVPFVFAFSLFLLGRFLESFAPGLKTDGPQLLVWGFFVSTTLLFHGTSCINSMAHLMGRRRFATHDDSRNSFILSVITLGEGWHNNHHRYQSSTRNGFYWWEIDPTYYGLRLLSALGFIWALKPVPQSVLDEGRGMLEPVAACLPKPHSVQPEFSELKHVMPAAAASAMASVDGGGTTVSMPPSTPSGLHNPSAQSETSPTLGPVPR